MASKKTTLTINDYTLEIDLKRIGGNLALFTVGCIIFGPWFMVVFGLFIVARYYLGWDRDWDWPYCDNEKDGKPKRQNSELVAEDYIRKLYRK